MLNAIGLRLFDQFVMKSPCLEIFVFRLRIAWVQPVQPVQPGINIRCVVEMSHFSHPFSVYIIYIIRKLFETELLRVEVCHQREKSALSSRFLEFRTLASSCLPALISVLLGERRTEDGVVIIYSFCLYFFEFFCFSNFQPGPFSNETTSLCLFFLDNEHVLPGNDKYSGHF